MKLLLIILILLLAILQYSLWLGPEGVNKTLSLKQEIAKQQQINSELYKKNELLVQQVGDLKHEKGMVETLAREKVGMIKSDETYYQVIENK